MQEEQEGSTGRVTLKKKLLLTRGSIAGILIIGTLATLYGAFTKATVVSPDEMVTLMDTPDPDFTPTSTTPVFSLDHILQEGEYVVVVGKGSGKKITKSILIEGGAPLNLEVSEDSIISTTQYIAGSTTYISKDSPNATIYSIYDFTGYDENGKIDTAIERKLLKKDKVSVIVRMKSTGRFYNSTDSATIRASKSQVFNNKKNSIGNSIKGNGSIKHDLQIIDGLAIEVNAKAFESLKKNPNVEKIDLDRLVTTLLNASVGEINAPYAWSLVDNAGNTVTGIGIRIAILDTGVDYTHPDLGGCLGLNCKVIGGWDFINNDADPMDDHGHGTHVAATAAGNGLLKGVAPDAKILAYKVLSAGGSGSFSGIIAAIQRATDPNNDGNSADHVDVANMSLGGSGNPDDAMSLAVDNSSAAGVIHAIAAGNSGPSTSTISSPGTARSAITVAAACAPHANLSPSHCANPIASFSSRGPVIWNGVDIEKPDITAPGVRICAARWGTYGSLTCFDTQRVRLSGTSMATPHIAGVAALMKQVNPTFTPRQIKDRLKATASPFSGMTYSDQGAGMVNVKTAIPTIPKVNTTPSVWEPTTDPTKKLSTSTQSFSVTSIDATIDTLTFNFTSPVAGITFEPSNASLSVANLGTDTFTGTITVDNDSAPAGKYNTVIYLQSSGVNKGAIVVPITITPTITTSTNLLDYGIDNPSLSSWTSTSIALTVTNRRTDISQTLAVSSGAFPSGIIYNQDASTTIIVPANGTITINTSFSVNNSLVPNGIYRGTFTLSNPANQATVRTKFVKFYVLTIQNSDPNDYLQIVALLNPVTWEKINVFPSSAITTVYLNNSGNYNILAYYASGTIVLKESIPIDGASTIFSVSRTEAKHIVKITGTDINNNNVLPQAHQVTFTSLQPGYSFGWMFVRTNGALISNVSSVYNISVTGMPYLSNSPNFYMFGAVQAGLSTNWDILNTVADLKNTAVQYDLNVPNGTLITPFVMGCMSSTCIGWLGDAQLPFSQTFYSSLKTAGFPFFVLARGSNNIQTVFSTNRFDLVDRKHSWFLGTFPVLVQDKLFNGLGPTVWFSKFNNTASQIQLIGGFNLPTPLLRQDYASTGHNSFPYSLHNKGNQVAIGNFASFDPFGYTFNSAIATIPLPSDQYEFRSSFPYQNQGKDLTGNVVATFNTALADKNPPLISRLYYFGNDHRVDIYDPIATHRLEVDLAPNGGMLSSITLSLSADGGAFNTVPISGNGTTYIATLPSVNATTKIALKLIVTDDSANSFQYTFELPTGSAPPPPPSDTILPVVSITAPTSGSIISGTATISANATDNAGVTKVDFYQDATLLGTHTTTPYSIGWNTTTVTNGTYNLTAKAYDTVGNVGTSTVVTVTVNNQIMDTTPPIVIITNPVDEAKLAKTGTTKIKVSATDSSGINNIKISVNNILKATCLAVTSCNYNLSNKNLSTGKHAITATATDNNNNHASVSITVKK